MRFLCTALHVGLVDAQPGSDGSLRTALGSLRQHRIALLAASGGQRERHFSVPQISRGMMIQWDILYVCMYIYIYREIYWIYIYICGMYGMYGMVI